ncbi:CHAT domain-containing protein [Vararia minispora EC-137]|uniref:CHAT domain-containing protein n=1 Tax=Vararia minispora EC-137 TaxID=1314806 RepID=A0ACB8Q6T5_9AGAM|nr:CHAT domain-containing protein [Vararia minispora EC-137]
MAVPVTQLILDCISPIDPAFPAALSEHAISLKNRFEQLGHLQDLDDAIAALRRVVELVPIEDPDSMLSGFRNLSHSLELRFYKLESLQDLKDAISILRRGLEILVDNPFNNSSCAGVQAGVTSGTLESRLDDLGHLLLFQETIAMQRRAVELTPDDHPEKAHHLLNLGVSMRFQLCCSFYRDHFLYAHNCFVIANSIKAGHPSIRLRAAIENASMCAEFRQFDKSYEMTLQAYHSMFASIPAFIWLGQGVSRRFEQLAEMGIGSLVTAAAATAVAAGMPSQALEWLEEGRNIVWAQLSRLRDPFDDLMIRDYALASKLKMVSAALEMVDSFASLTSSSRQALEDEARNHRRLAAEYERLLTQVRLVDGFESFLCKKTLTELAPVCRTGPVVLINVDQSRSDALIICDLATLIHLPLPKITFEVASGMNSLLQSSRRSLGLKDRSTIEVRYSSQENINVILERLWTSVVQPVLSRIQSKLRAQKSADLPHITWCPTGPLSFLPLHAAGVYGGRGLPTQKAYNLVVSSYTTSVSALLSACAQQGDSDISASTNPKILAVSQPLTPNLPPIEGTVMDVIAITKHFPENVTHLSNSSATVDAVLDSMSKHNWVHLACHGKQDRLNGIKSCFALHDGPLALSQIMGISNAQAELAVLLACETATGSEDLPEEAVHLTSGMFVAGYKSVVATLWSIADVDAPFLADVFYGVLRRNLESGKGLKVAYALHEAVAELREKILGGGERDTFRWIPFVHIGV